MHSETMKFDMRALDNFDSFLENGNAQLIDLRSNSYN